jgi:hypothetical protein
MLDDRGMRAPPPGGQGPATRRSACSGKAEGPLKFGTRRFIDLLLRVGTNVVVHGSIRMASLFLQLVRHRRPIRPHIGADIVAS